MSRLHGVPAVRCDVAGRLQSLASIVAMHGRQPAAFSIGKPNSTFIQPTWHTESRLRHNSASPMQKNGHI
jgi:hypothetical protein